MRPVNVRVWATLGTVLLTCGAAMAQTESNRVTSSTIAGYHEQAEVPGKVIVATTSQSALTFTETAVAVKLRNVVFSFLLLDPSAAALPKYILPRSLTLDGIEIDGKPFNLSTNATTGPCLDIRAKPNDPVLGCQPAIVYFTLPNATAPVECRLILSEAHLQAVVGPKAGGTGEGTAARVPEDTARKLAAPTH
jgi:hypothetical protein